MQILSKEIVDNCVSLILVEVEHTFCTPKCMYLVINFHKDGLVSLLLLQSHKTNVDSRLPNMCTSQLKNGTNFVDKFLYTVNHIYNNHAYNEMTLITKHLGIPDKHSIYFFINFTLSAKLHITKSRFQ